MTKSAKRRKPPLFTVSSSSSSSLHPSPTSADPLLDPSRFPFYTSSGKSGKGSSTHPMSNGIDSFKSPPPPPASAAPGLRNSLSGYKTYQQNKPQIKRGSHRQSSRLMDRSGYFRQSKGEWNVSRRGGAWLYAPFYLDDWFHSVLNAPTHRVFLILFVMYLLFVSFYAACYLYIATAGQGGEGGGCGMDVASLLEALYFSLETMTTLGYGVSDYYFGDW